MQATYVMVANKQALPYLPAGADVNALTYAQLQQWGKNIADKTGQRRLGFPAGPKGLLPRFFQGYLYPVLHRRRGDRVHARPRRRRCGRRLKALWAT